MANDPHSRSVDLFDDLQNQLQQDWETLRDTSFNKNKKGQAFEEALIDLLELYFGELYIFENRVQLLDDHLMTLSMFSPDENEFDVVALYRQTSPHYVLYAHGLGWVPYSGVAFVCEVKARPNKSAVEEDIQKLSTLRSCSSLLDGAPFGMDLDRFVGMSVGHPVAEDRQLHCLVYDKTDDIAKETLIELLSDNQSAWDVALLVEEDMLIVNPNTKFANLFQQVGGEQPLNPLTAEAIQQLHQNYADTYEDHDVIIGEHGLFRFIFFLSTAIRQGPIVNTIGPMLSLMVHSIFDRMDIDEIESLYSPHFIEGFESGLSESDTD